MRILATLALAASLAGCAGTSQNDIETPMDDGYQLFDGIDTVITLQARYCATANPERRAALLTAIRVTGLSVPDSGACTDILSLIDTADIPDIDVEQAREDQKRFQNENRDPGSSADSEADQEGSQEP